MNNTEIYPPKPQALAVFSEGIPAELKDRPQWLAWRYVPRERRWDKVPVCCWTGKAADATEPAAWSSFEQALQYYNEHSLDGVGFAFSSNDPFVGIDLDKCRNPNTEKLQPWATRLVEGLNSYAEVSPSGTGVKVFVKGLWPTKEECRKGDVEVYGQARYFTLTGWRLTSTPNSIQDRPDQLLRLHKWLARGEASEEHLICQAAKNATFARLWKGDTSGYQSQSEADLALCNLLVNQLGPHVNAGRVEQLFNRSALAMRKKWERQDYRERTIGKALEDRRGPFDDPMLTRIFRTSQDEPGDPTRRASPPGVSLTPEQEQQAVTIAMELADSERDRPDWQTMFILARKLRVLLAGEAGSPESFQKAVLAFCERADVSAEDYWNCFRVCWGKVRLAEGENVFEWAANMARKHPYMSAAPLKEKYAFVASLAWHLAEFRRPKPFWLPVCLIASLLNTNAMNVSRVIDLLKQDGIVRCVKENYSFKRRLAKEYVFTGPPPADAAA